MKLSKSLPEILRLARGIQTYWEQELPKRHPNYPIVNAGEDSGPPPPETAQLEALLEKYTDEQVYALVFLVYVGLGSFHANDSERGFNKLHEAFPHKAEAVSLLLNENPLADILEDGISLLEQEGLDIDSLYLTPVTQP